MNARADGARTIQTEQMGLSAIRGVFSDLQKEDPYLVNPYDAHNLIVQTFPLLERAEKLAWMTGSPNGWWNKKKDN